MDATTMSHIQSVISEVQSNFPSIRFEEGAAFVWQPTIRRITYLPIKSFRDVLSLLHEVAHAELSHRSFDSDIELLSHEVAAWDHVKNKLAAMYKVKIEEDFIDEQLDTYRLWLHNRSLCPQCGINGFQASQNTYSCSNCRCKWRVNEARTCSLKRIRQLDPNRSS